MNAIVKIVTYLAPAAIGTLLLIFLAIVHTALGSVHTALAAVAVFVITAWVWINLDHDGHQEP